MIDVNNLIAINYTFMKCEHDYYVFRSSLCSKLILFLFLANLSVSILKIPGRNVQFVVLFNVINYTIPFSVLSIITTHRA